MFNTISSLHLCWLMIIFMFFYVCVSLRFTNRFKIFLKIFLNSSTPFVCFGLKALLTFFNLGMTQHISTANPGCQCCHLFDYITSIYVRCSIAEYEFLFVLHSCGCQNQSSVRVVFLAAFSSMPLKKKL